MKSIKSLCDHFFSRFTVSRLDSMQISAGTITTRYAGKSAYIYISKHTTGSLYATIFEPLVYPINQQISEDASIPSFTDSIWNF